MKKIYFKEESSKFEDLQNQIIEFIEKMISKKTPKQSNENKTGFLFSLKNSLGQLKSLNIVFVNILSYKSNRNNLY